MLTICALSTRVLSGGVVLFLSGSSWCCSVTRVFAYNFGWVGCFLWFVSYIKSIATHEKVFAVGKSGSSATFTLIFLGGWVDLGLGSSSVS